MAERPIANLARARLVAAQTAGQSHIDVSYESETVSLGISEPINVEGVSYVFVYGAANALCFDAPGDTAVALEDATGTAVAITTARLVDVRGVRHMQFSAAVTVTYTG